MIRESRRLYPATLPALLVLLSAAMNADADTFGTANDSFDIEFVTIGSAGNPPDTTGNPNPAGSVDYDYRIGKYEISREMIDAANRVGDLEITMLDMTQWGGERPNLPASEISWLEAARFVNWLNVSSGYPEAYKLLEQPAGLWRPRAEPWRPGEDGYNPNNTLRHRLAYYFLPTEDEWYKAAYYDPDSGNYFDYPTGTDSPPFSVAEGTTPGTAVFDRDVSLGPAPITRAGGLSPYGTMAQGGNVNEWTESVYEDSFTDISPRHLVRGGALGYEAYRLSVVETTPLSPDAEVGGVGFRVVSVPEPSLTPWIASTIALLFSRRIQRQACTGVRQR